MESPSPVQSSTLDSLPKQFVSAMRTLFDIMDDKKAGLINFADIENRWQDDDSKGLPKGVIESLRKVTPSNGMLSFERFCAGLKICLLRNQNPLKRASDVQSNSRPPSAPLLDVVSPPKPPVHRANTVAVRPNQISPQRTLSMPQLLAKKEEKPVPKQPILYGPPKPPRSAAVLGNLDRAEIRTALQNWQIGLMMNDQELKNGQYPRSGRSLGDGKAAPQPDNAQKKTNSRRREPRRHTLQNGIDYNMLKRMKQIEQEKDVLMQGLSGIDKAREWYLKQIANVQEKMKYLGRMGHVVSITDTIHKEVCNYSSFLELNPCEVKVLDFRSNGPKHNRKGSSFKEPAFWRLIDIWLHSQTVGKGAGYPFT